MQTSASGRAYTTAELPTQQWVATRRAGQFRSYCFWEPVSIELDERHQKIVYVTVERTDGDYNLAAYGLCRCADPELLLPMFELTSGSRHVRRAS